MKKFLFAIVAMLLSAHVYAQPTSLWVTESNDSLQNYHIIKDWSGGTAIGVCTKRNGPLALAKVPFTATYPVAEPLLVLDPTIMNIYDMCIVDDEIFFCGNYLDSNSGDIIGFIGHANTTSFSSADYVVFSSTSFVGSIVAYNHPAGYKIVAVGHKPSGTSSFVGDHHIIEIDHDGTSFLPTYAPPNNVKYAFPLPEYIPTYMTVTDSYVAITGTIYDTPSKYFIIRCDKSSPVATVLMYVFIDPAYMGGMPAPDLTQLNKDTVAVAYSNSTNTTNDIIVRTVDLNTMIDINAQQFRIEAKNPTPHPVYFDITRTLVLFSSDSYYPTITSAPSSFVYIDPYATSFPYYTTYAFQSSATISNSCHSIAKLGTRHFMGRADKGWYSQEHNALTSTSTNCLDRYDIIIDASKNLSSTILPIYTGQIQYDTHSFATTNSVDIDKICETP